MVNYSLFPKFDKVIKMVTRLAYGNHIITSVIAQLGKIYGEVRQILTLGNKSIAKTDSARAM